MRKSKASKKRQPATAKVTKRTTSRRATTSRSRTSGSARRPRRVSPKSIPPAGLVQLPKLTEQAVAVTPALSSNRYPIRNLLVLLLAVVATTAVGAWAAYVALFGEARQAIDANPYSVVLAVPLPQAPATEAAPPKPEDRVAVTSTTEDRVAVTPKLEDRVAATPGDAAISSISREESRSAPIAPEVTAALPTPTSEPALLGPTQPAAGGPAPAPQAPIAAKGKRRGHPEATAIAPTGPGGGAYAFVAEARRYLGTNPTGRRDLWCGAFVDLVLKRLGYKGGGNLASAYARYGTRVPGPQIGAIAVMTRVGGGHVGIVSGFDSKGRPIIISGNYKRRVAEVVYPAGRIYAYVIPKDWGRVTAQTH